MRYSGAGNTFILIDNRDHHFIFSGDCDADGILLLEESQVADFKMRTINKDGSEAEMCGNGLRCFVRFLKDIRIDRETYQIETLAGVYSAAIANEHEVCVQMQPPKDLHWEPPFYHLNTGVPHTVYFVDSLDKIDVEMLGRELRKKYGSNINFALLNPDGSISIRTYERGVEAETLACGTGATASALVAAKVHCLPSPIEVRVHSGEKIKISFTPDWQKITVQGSCERLSFPLKEKSSILAFT